MDHETLQVGTYYSADKKMQVTINEDGSVTVRTRRGVIAVNPKSGNEVVVSKA